MKTKVVVVPNWRNFISPPLQMKASMMVWLQRAVHDRDIEIIESQFDIPSDLGSDHEANASDDSGDEVWPSVTLNSCNIIMRYMVGAPIVDHFSNPHMFWSRRRLCKFSAM